MIFANNTVYEDKVGKIYRVLKSDGRYGGIWVIELTPKRVQPILENKTELINRFTNRELELIDDLYKSTYVKEENLTKKQKRKLDQNWTRIADIVTREPEIFFSDERAKLVNEAAKRHNCTRQTIYECLRRYWQGGKTKSAVLSKYRNCGGKGKPKKAGENKRGRPPKESSSKGINITDEVLVIFRLGWTKFYINVAKATIKYAFEMTLIVFYEEYIEVKRNDDGRIKVKILDHDKIPNYRQFCYYLKKELNRAARLKKRLGEREFEKSYRQLFDTSLSGLLGPGSQYQIDATIMNVYLVSRLDSNRVVGRPTLYKVIDVFSRMVVGIYIGLEAPSWYCHMMALLNVVEDKVEFCKRYGVHIEREEWDVQELPVELLGDNGELKSNMAEQLNYAFHIEVGNTQSYRGDCKGAVERSFKTVDEELGNYIPGYVEADYKTRVGRDYRLDAKLNIDELTATVIYSVLDMNNNERRGYPGDPEIVADGEAYVPAVLWKWGIEKYRSDLQKFDYEYALLHLLPREDVTITREGIRFVHQLYYKPTASMLSEVWYFEAMEKNLKTKAVYHPGDITTIHVISPYDENVVYKCELTNSCERFSGLTLVEVDEHRREERKISANAKVRNMERHLEYKANMYQIMVDGVTRSDSEKDPTLSNAERVRDIRTNKKEELRHLQSEKAESLTISNQDDKPAGRTLEHNNPDEARNRKNLDKLRERLHKHSSS